MAAAQLSPRRPHPAALALVVVAALVLSMLGFVAPAAALPGDITVNDVTLVEGTDAGTTNATFVISSESPTLTSTTVTYTTRNGSAIAPGDYTAVTGTHTFSLANSGPHQVVVPIIREAQPEPNEDFFLDVTVTAGSGSCDDCTGRAEIINDDGAPPVLSVNDLAAPEAGPNPSFTVTRSGDATGTVTVNYSTTNGTATAGADYTTTSGTLTFGPNETTKPIVVPILQDTTDEPDETFNVVLSNPSNAVIAADGDGVGTITDDDLPPTLSIDDQTIAEGSTGTSQMVFTVSLSAASGNIVQVNFNTADGPAPAATAPADYGSRSGTLTFNPGQTTGTISVPIVGDTADEANERFTVSLSGAVNASVADGSGLGTITDDDAEPTLSIDNVTKAEGNSGSSSAQFTVSLSGPTTQTVTVAYATSNGTTNPATAGSDYTSTSGTLTFAPGEVLKTINVPVLGDTLHEANETFNVTLSSPTVATIADGSGLGTITNDDAVPTLTVSDSGPVVENNVTTPFTVTLSAASGQTVTVNYTTSNGSATAGVDYTTTSGTLTFVAGDTTKTVNVPILEDGSVEGAETFTLTLSAPANATLADATGTGTITDDDANQFSITDQTVNEAAGTVTFTVSRPDGGGPPATVQYATANNTATAGSDYTAPTPGTLTFNGGDLEETITVTITNDLTPETTETFFVNLSNPSSNATIVDGQGVGTILDNDGPLPATVSIAPSSATEGAASTTTPMTFTVTRAGDTTQAVTVTYTTTNGTATAGADYTAETGTVTIPTGQTTATFDIDVLGDGTDEPNETFTVTLSNPTNATLGSPSSATGTINDDDATPVITVSSPTVTEGTGGTSTLSFTVTLATPSSGTVTVDYTTGGGTATADVDYAATSGTLTFDPGQTSKVVDVVVSTDAVDEDNETVVLTLSNPSSNATIGGGGTGTGTINDDDAEPTIAIGDVTVPEGNSGSSDAVFTVNLSTASGRTVTATYTTSNDTATAGSDYASSTGTVTFAAGETTQTIAIPVTGDTTDEGNETFTVTLTAPSNATFSDDAGTGTITDDDDAPTVSVGDVTVTEGHSGTVNADFAVTLSNPSASSVTVTATTSDGTAVANGDYTAKTATVTFTPGQTTQTFTVLVNGDLIDEANETFTVTLTVPTNATLGDATGTGTITDDDGQPTVSIDDVTVTEGNASDVTATFTVSLSNPSSQAVTVDVATANATATEPADYTSNTATLTFAAGQTSLPFAVTVKGDTIDEADETFNVNVTLGTGETDATIGDGAGVGTITDNDGSPTISIGNATVTEGSSGTSNASFTVTLSNASASTVTVAYATANGSAVQPGDYTTTSGTVTFVPNDTSETITVPVVGDSLDEPNETFTVTLSSPTNATIATATGTGTITDDDGAPSLSVNDISATEGNLGTKAVTFTVTLSSASGQAVTAAFATSAGTATSNIDYRDATGTVTIPAGQTTATISVNFVGDEVDEADETFNVTLSSPTNATIADGTGVATITDDDAPAPTTPTAAPQGYSLVGEDGSLYAFGTAKNLGDMRGQRLNAPIIGVAYTPGGNGYWLVARDGGIFTFGDAEFFGSMGDKRLNSPVIGMAATPSGKGYWLFAGDGGIFTFGDAEFFGSMGDQKLNAPVINMEPLASGRGYWLVAADGGIFTFGLGDFFGSMGDKRINQPVFDMTSTDSDRGYWLVARDGGIFSFGDAEPKFFGSAVNETPRPTKVIGMDSTPGSQGYWIADASGKVYRYGDAQDLGDRFGQANPAPMVAFATVPSLK